MSHAGALGVCRQAGVTRDDWDVDADLLLVRMCMGFERSALLVCMRERIGMRSGEELGA